MCSILVLCSHRNYFKCTNFTKLIYFSFSSFVSINELTSINLNGTFSHSAPNLSRIMESLVFSFASDSFRKCVETFFYFLLFISGWRCICISLLWFVSIRKGIASRNPLAKPTRTAENGNEKEKTANKKKRKQFRAKQNESK